METVYKYVNYVRTPFEVYTREEADERGIAYVPWRDAQPGQFAISDDGYVGKCIGVSKKIKKGKNVSWKVVLPWGAFWNQTKYLSYEAEREKKAGRKPGDWAYNELKRPRTACTLSLYARLMLASDGRLTEDQMRALGKMYRPDRDPDDASIQLKRLIRTEGARKMIAEELEKILNGEGITKESVIRMYTETFEKARDTNNAAAMRSVAKDLADMLDMKVDRTVREDSMEMTVNFEHLLDEEEEAPELAEYSQAGQLDARPVKRLVEKTG